VVFALIPTRRAEGREGVEDGDPQWAAVDECASVVGDDLRMLTDQGGDPAAHVGHRIFGRR
jgi:hypothetical protein